MGDPVTQLVIEKKKTFVLHPLKSQNCETTGFCVPHLKNVFDSRKIFNLAVLEAKTFSTDIAHCDSTVHSL